ncbi:DUF4143 domain-containing protein [Bifidobacterium thermophilum]|uniref:DUF4143 domain-containing protein n=1 Tax=Bifidobacterium thermophilum TaxID=33905 RepID=UPI0030988DCD
MTIGGMPEAVQSFVSALGNGPHSLNDVPSAHALAAARAVQNRHQHRVRSGHGQCVQTEDSAKIFEAWRSIPTQLANYHKFQYKAIRSGARAAQYMPAIDWLASAGIVNLCTQVTEPVSPLAAFENPTAFKVYMEDTGLLMARYGATMVQLNPSDSKTANFRGAVAENFVMQTLVAAGLKPYYWGTPSKGELEFLLDMPSPVHQWALPLEVKSGRHVSARSLAAFQTKYSPDYVIRISTKNMGFDRGIRSVPLYAVQALTEELATESSEVTGRAH